MTEGKIDLLVINGIGNAGSAEVVRASSHGRIAVSLGGSCNVSANLPRDVVNPHQFLLDHHEQQQIDINHILNHDVVFCEIADPDSHSKALSKACKLFDLLQGRIPWINNPHKVWNTGRESVSILLSDIAGVVAPKTLKFNPASIDGIKSAIESNGYSFPVLLRPAGSHGGHDLVQIGNYAELENLDPGKYREAFLTQFIDFSVNGIYAKYRIVVIAGEPFLRHLLFKDHWMIHREARAFTEADPELKEAEAETFQHFEVKLKPQIAGIVREIHSRLGLDYFGMDCSIKNGQLILFEVNANMNVFFNNQPSPNIWEQALDRMREKVLQNLIFPRVA